MDKTDYAWKVNDYLNSYVQFADLKAGFVVALATLSLGFSGVSPANLPLWGSITLALASLPTLVALLMALWSVRPRTTFRPARGTIFWENIDAHGCAHDYVEAVTGCDCATEVLTQNFQVARVVKSKYSCVRYATTLLLIGLPFQWLASGALRMFSGGE